MPRTQCWKERENRRTSWACWPPIQKKASIIQSSNEESKQEKESQLVALTYLNVINDTEKEKDAKEWLEEEQKATQVTGKAVYQKLI